MTAYLDSAGLAHVVELIPAGKDAQITSVEATVDDQTGPPSVEASISGPAGDQKLTLAFHGLKGEEGLPGVAGNGVCSPIDGYYGFSVDDRGNLFLHYNDGETKVPTFSLDEDTGNLYWVVDE